MIELEAREIAAMKPGPKLDSYVGWLVFGDTNSRRPPYSTTDKCIRVMTHAKIIAGEMHPKEPAFNAQKPYFAQSQDKSVTVIAATLPSAICKAACIQSIEAIKASPKTG